MRCRVTEEKEVKREAEIGAMQPQAKETWAPRAGVLVSKETTPTPAALLPPPCLVHKTGEKTKSKKLERNKSKINSQTTLAPPPGPRS